MSANKGNVLENSGADETPSRAGEFDFGIAEWEETHLITVPVDRVWPDPKQPRKHLDEESLADLGRTLRMVQVQPIVVRREGSGWVLVDGERRWRAARAEGLPTLLAREMNLTRRVELVSMVIQLVANTHRDQLTLEEEALGVLRLAEGGFPISAIARALGHNEDRVVSLLAVARSGEARALIGAGRLASVSAWDAYQALDPPERKRVLDSTDQVTVERCERVRREKEHAERAKQQRLAMPRPSAAADQPQWQSEDESATDETPLTDAEVDAMFEDNASAPRAGGVRARRLTHLEALLALHDRAHKEREALVTGLDGVREELDAGIVALAGHAEITETAFAAVRAALAPAEARVDRALKHIVRPPELAPCCAQSFAERHYQKEPDAETAIAGADNSCDKTAEQRS
jgi:ParB/RepB/Spo0J family partition protein